MDGFINTNTINSHFKKIAKDADIRVVYKDIKRGKKTIRHKTSTVSTHQIRHCFRLSLRRGRNEYKGTSNYNGTFRLYNNRKYICNSRY